MSLLKLFARTQLTSFLYGYGMRFDFLFVRLIQDALRQQVWYEVGGAYVIHEIRVIFGDRASQIALFIVFVHRDQSA